MFGGGNIYAYVFGNPISNIDPNGLECDCSKSAADNFVDTYVDNRNVTKDAISSWGGKAVAAGVGALLGKGKTVANAVGGITIGQAIKSIPSGGVAVSGSLAGTAYSAAATSLVGAAATSASLEVGISVGSLGVATVDAAKNALTCP